MHGKSFAQLALVSVFLLMSTDTRQVTAANMRSFIEGVRRKAPVVYVGSVREVRQLGRKNTNSGGRSAISTTTWRQDCGLRKLLRKHRSSWISHAGYPRRVAETC